MSYLREVGQSRPYYNKDKGKMARSCSRTSRWLTKRLKTGLLRRKVSPFSVEYGGGAMGGKDAVLRKEAYHYLFVVQTYSGSRVDLYRSQLPSHGGGGGGRFALRSHLRL